VICDASVIVGFVAADKQQLFLDVIKCKNITLKVPVHVNGEIERVLSGSTGAVGRGSRLPSRWRWLRNALGTDTVLPPVVFPGPIGSVADKFATLKDVVGFVVTPRMRDGGEYFVVAHALAIQGRGEEVSVAVDDTFGRKLATLNNLTVISTIELFGFAIDLGLLSNLSELENAYDAVGQFSTLPTLSASRLDRRFLS
jgi:hypothetical protein